MPRRTTTTELCDRLDGVALGFFTVTAALVDALIEVHPDGEDLWQRLPMLAERMLLELEVTEQDVFSDEAIEQAYKAVMAAFSGRRESEASNDNG